ncbi:hypothetical protein K1719_002105 [Acacia pycnantha]|nr:hypothetical protein K1719_002105 [Acacia pycnantha]
MEEPAPSSQRSYWRRWSKQDFFPEESFQSLTTYRTALSQTLLRFKDSLTSRSEDATETDEIRKESENDMKLCLNWWDLIWFGLGSAIGAGIFVLTAPSTLDARSTLEETFKVCRLVAYLKMLFMQRTYEDIHKAKKLSELLSLLLDGYFIFFYWTGCLYCSLKPNPLDSRSWISASAIGEEIFLLQSKVQINGCVNQPRLQRVESATFKRPCLDFLQDTEEARKNFLDICVPLFKYASEGNWEKAEPIFEDKKLLTAGIAKGWTTALHVAAGAGHVDFVKKLVALTNESDLVLQDFNGSTALSFAAIAGNLEIVELLYQKNNTLPKIRSRIGLTPILLAALQGRANVANYLYPLTTDDNNFDVAEWNKLFLTCIDSGIYDLAMKVLEGKPEVAFARDEDDKRTGLHILAQKTEDVGSGTKNSVALQLVRSLWERILRGKLCIPGTKNSVALELVHELWKRILRGVDSQLKIKEIINEPSTLLFDATKVGNFYFLAELIKAYPDLIWLFDENGLSIIHAAVLHRQPEIFYLIREYSGIKDIILEYKDDDRNNILHLAAKLAPADRLELVSGAAFQMKLELLWFQEVKKIVQPSFANKKNSKGKTPHDLFTGEHAKLRKQAEKWMNTTADKCMLVSTLITTGVLAAAFTVPGGINDSGTPNYLWKASFMVFSISDTIALISSSVSIVTFLSILVSRNVEDDFYKSLPSKLIFGLITLFVSITSMMVSFSSAFFMTYDHGHGLNWVPSFISVLSISPIAIFLLFQFRLFWDIIFSAYYSSSLFKPSKRVLS